MKQLTFKARLMQGLANLGWTQEPTASRKYVCFAPPAGYERHTGKGWRLFVGKNGALRSGRVASHSSSIGDPCDQTKFYRNVLAASELPLSA